MGSVGCLVLLVIACTIGIAAQAVMRNNQLSVWCVGTVWALYGTLAANGLFQVGPAMDGLYIIPATLGGVLMASAGELSLQVFNRRGRVQSAQAPADSTVHRYAWFAYSPELFQHPIIYQVERQFGVVTKTGNASISGTHGWVDMQIVGTPTAVHEAVAWAQAHGLQIRLEGEIGPAPELRRAA